MTTSDPNLPRTPPLISCHEALRIAHADALAAYRDLSAFRITLVLQADGWHIEYDLINPLWSGGGPHYIIDAESGQIVWKRYYQ